MCLLWCDYKAITANPFSPQQKTENKQAESGQIVTVQYTGKTQEKYVKICLTFFYLKSNMYIIIQVFFSTFNYIFLQLHSYKLAVESCVVHFLHLPQ